MQIACRADILFVDMSPLFEQKQIELGHWFAVASDPSWTLRRPFAPARSDCRSKIDGLLFSRSS